MTTFNILSVSNSKRNFRTDALEAISRYLVIETPIGLIDYHTNQEVNSIDWESRVIVGETLPIEAELVERFCERVFGTSYQTHMSKLESTQQMIDAYQTEKGVVDYSDAQA